MLPPSEPSQVSCKFVSDEVDGSGNALRITAPFRLLPNTTAKISCSQHIVGLWNSNIGIFFVTNSVRNRRKFHAVELFVLLILCSSCGHVDCRLQRTPQNVAESVGKQVFMSCATNNTVHPCQDMVWTHYTAHTSVPNVICMENNVSPLVSHYISMVDLNDGKCNLKIKTQTSAEGSYECTTTTNGKKASASLIILASYPECLVKTFVNETGEYSNITCSVEYFGDWAPTMEWIKMTGQNSISISSYESHTSDQIVSDTLVVPHNVSSGYTCIMKFTEQGRNIKATATNVPDYKWKSLIFGEYGGEERSKEEVCATDCIGLKKLNSFFPCCEEIKFELASKNIAAVVGITSTTLVLLMIHIGIVMVLEVRRRRRRFNKRTKETAETSLRE